MRLLNDVSLALCVLVWLRIVVHPYVGDASAYWGANLDRLYGGVPGQMGAFLYSPAFAQITHPVTLLPWATFYALWTGAQIGMLAWLTGLPLAAVILVFQPIGWGAVASGNIEVLIAAVIVVGFRYPAAWSVILLTKVTPGIGLLWFAVRREWRSLGIALAMTAVIAGISLIAAPSLWADWIGVLRTNAGIVAPFSLIPLPVLPRLVVAALLIAWGARTDRRWVVPVAVLLSLPYVPWSQVLILAAVPRLMVSGTKLSTSDPPPRAVAAAAAPA